MSIKTKLHYYWLDISKNDQAYEYGVLKNTLESLGLKLFDSISFDGTSFYRDKIRPLDNKNIDLETKHLFNNQWNTAPIKEGENGLRVFDWSETIVPNKDIKIGMWLEQTSEMKEIRENTTACGFCGHQFAAQKGYIFCPDCLDSEYLNKSELYLLRLMPVIKKGVQGKRKPLSKAEYENLKPQYIKAQTTGKNSRALNKKKRLLIEKKEKATKIIENARAERDGFLWLLKNNINTENCIYYSHTGRFCFGWRNTIDSDVKSELLDLLCEFPFDYDIKD